VKGGLRLSDGWRTGEVIEFIMDELRDSQSSACHALQPQHLISS
jgi:uncharacterized protein YoaH (UPF0181 family)